MQYSLLVGVFHRPAKLRDQLEESCRVQALSCDVHVQGQTFHVLHHVVGQGPHRARQTAHVIDAGDPRMQQAPHGFDLTLEARGQLLGPDGGPEDLEGYEAFGLLLPRQVDRSHTTLTQETLDSISIELHPDQVLRHRHRERRFQESSGPSVRIKELCHTM